MRKPLAGGLIAALLSFGLVAVAPSAGADPAQAGEGSAFGATVTLTDQALLPPTPEVSAVAPDFPADASETLIPIPADPLAVNATLTATAAVHKEADLTSSLEVEDQPVAGPYNAKAVGEAESVDVLIDAVATDVPLVEADALRGEVVARCVGETVEYAASSDVVNLVVAGDDTLGGVLNDIIDQLFPGLDPLDPLVNLETNVITELDGGGLAVDALVVTVLEAADDTVGLAQVRVGHAELSGVTCGPDDVTDPPECSDDADNDDDALVDEADPGCHTDGNPDNPDSYDPNDDDETDGGPPACSDGVDNDGDVVIDEADPGCHTDGNALNPDSYDPNDDDESNPLLSLPRTGSAAPTATGLALGLAALGLLALRRRLVV